MLKNEFEALALIAPNGILNLDPRNTTINLLYINGSGIASINNEILSSNACLLRGKR